MMMHMLSFNSGGYSGATLRFMGHAGVPESCSFAFEFLSCLRGIIMLEVSVLHWGYGVELAGRSCGDGLGGPPGLGLLGLDMMSSRPCCETWKWQMISAACGNLVLNRPQDAKSTT
jgi:hypothetical protein